MPRFYFDIADARRASIDESGVELASIEDARRMALRSLGDLAKDQFSDGEGREFTLTVRDHDRKALLVATLTLRVAPVS